MSLPYEKLPEFARGPLKRWIEDGTHPGGFFGAVLTNDLVSAVHNGGAGALENLVPIVKWVNMWAPSVCWGSEAKVRAWVHHNAHFRLCREDE